MNTKFKNNIYNIQLTILLVEDNEGDADLIKELLVRQDGGQHEIIHVKNLKDAVSSLASLKIDIILLDLRLPDGVGIECLNAIQSSARDIPIVVLTGMHDEMLALSCIEAGAQDYISKEEVQAQSLKRSIGYAIARSEIKKMEAELFISDRMASLGILVAGVAHEINNPLAIILSHIVIIIEKLSQNINKYKQLQDPLLLLNNVKEAAERIQNIVKDLKIFSRVDLQETRYAFDINTILDSVIKMAWHEICTRAKLIKEYGTIKKAYVNESRIFQVFLNLIVNAAQAIPENNKEINQIRVVTRMTEDGKIAIDIKDTGTGIPPEIQQHLFTQFFTTKPVGLGTGLGLAICQRIVESLDGEITFVSELGVGTCFTVLLPAAPTEIIETQKKVIAKPIVEKKEKIMVIDDEPSLTKVVKLILESDYDVYCFNSSITALEYFKNDPNFDLIISDLRMPEMHGIEFYQRIISFMPTQNKRFLFMSGNIWTPEVHQFIESNKIRVLEKPFNNSNLYSLVNELISENIAITN